jgi:hypothetical protein
MAIYTHNDVYLSFGGTEISDHVTSLTLNTGIETLDKTAMGSSTRINRAGLGTWSLEFECLNDFAASELDAIIDGLTGNEAAIEVRPVNTTVGATNPKWTGTALVTSYGPIAGAVGDQAKVSCSCVAASALTRAES